MKHLPWIIIVFLAITVAVLVTFDSARDAENERVIDSLTKVATDAIKAKKISEDSSKFYRIMSDTWYNEAQKTPKQKIVTRIQYVKDTAFNRSLSQRKRDSIIRATFFKP